jgi:hypothetical protein
MIEIQLATMRLRSHSHTRQVWTTGKGSGHNARYMYRPQRLSGVCGLWCSPTRSSLKLHPTTPLFRCTLSPLPLTSEQRTAHTGTLLPIGLFLVRHPGCINLRLSSIQIWQSSWGARLIGTSAWACGFEALPHQHHLRKPLLLTTRLSLKQLDPHKHIT